MAKTFERFAGVYSAMLTPYDKRGKVSEKTIEKLVNWHIKSGLRGFYICGSTGEGILLKTEERKRIAARAVKAAGGRAVVIVHVGHPSSDEAAELARIPVMDADLGRLRPLASDRVFSADDVQTWLSVGKSKAYQLLKYGQDVGTVRRLGSNQYQFTEDANDTVQV